jgi:hypothetical protein
VYSVAPTDSSVEVTKWFTELRSVSIQETRASPSKMIPVVIDDKSIALGTVEVEFINLNPLKRVLWLFWNEPWKLALLIFTGSAALYAIMMSIGSIIPYISRIISIGAFADESNTRLNSQASDPTQFVLLGLLGLITLAAIGLWIASKEAKKSAQGYEFVKGVGVAIVGFAVGKKS